MTRTLLRSVAVAVVLGMSALGLAACGSSGGTTIVLYNGQHEETTDAIVQAFEQRTGITVEVRSDDEDTLADLVASQGTRSAADVIWTENSLPLEYLQGLGLLAPVRASTLASTPRQYDSPQGDWAAISARVSVIIYNPSLISRSSLPTSVLQLDEPRFRGLLAFAPSETDFQPIITDVSQVVGRARALAWLEGVAANASGHTYPDNETIADEVNRGVVAFGVINQYYWYRMRAEIGSDNMHSKLAYFAPRDPGYVVDVSGAAVLAGASHPSAAQRFLAFLVSKQAQAIIADPSRSISFEYPLDAGVTTLAPETPFRSLQPFPTSIARLGDGSVALALLREAGLL